MKPVVDESALFEWGDESPPLPSRPMPAVPGYDQLVEIGRGGMGVVYRARHLRLNRTVALKLLRGGATASLPDRERFLREARAGAALKHPQIVQVYDVGEHIGVPYLAMELVEGHSLAERLANGPMPPRDAAQLNESLARAVEYAHQQGVVHRDLKPANILVGSEQWAVSSNDHMSTSVLHTAHSPLPTVKIADFGLARLNEDDSGTLSGTIIGTPSYMAPEQAMGRVNQIGPVSDVYSLGAILYECLTGRPPFRAASPVETLHQVESMEPVAPSRLQHSTPHDLSTICLTCLQKDPRRRYASAGALADDLQRFNEGRPIHARAVGPAERTWRWCRRNPRVALLLGALAFAIAGGFVGIFSQWRRAERLFTVADQQRREAEANLKRYQQAAEDFADLVDLIDMDQLLNIRAASMRRELLVPALDRNRRFLAQFQTDPSMRAETVRAQIHVAVLMRVLNQSVGTLEARQESLAEGKKALAALETYASAFPDVVQYRRDRAALTQNVGFLTHSVQRFAEALPILESARLMRKELLDKQPDHLDYRSELASTYNDIGLIHQAMQNHNESLNALQQAIELQEQAVRLAPHVQRFRRFLCNHHFNKAMTLHFMNRPSEASVAVNKCNEVLPHDPEQWLRIARIHASISTQANAREYEEAAMSALRQAIQLGYHDVNYLKASPNLTPLHQRPDYVELIAELERRFANAERQ